MFGNVNASRESPSAQINGRNLRREACTSDLSPIDILRITKRALLFVGPMHAEIERHRALL